MEEEEIHGHDSPLVIADERVSSLPGSPARL